MILAQTTAEQWRYVGSVENPADIASRGLSPEKLRTNELWWEGPNWLKLHCSKWPKATEFNLNEENETKTFLTVSICGEINCEILNKCSNLQKLINVLAYILKFFNICRKKQKADIKLTTDELESAANLVIKIVQQMQFLTEIQQLSATKLVPKNSSIRNLNPFIDHQGLMRVGGRLEHSNLSFNQKHPLILPYKSHITKLVIQQFHKRSLHGGTALTLSLIRQKYWIIKGKMAVKTELRKCIKCLRYKIKVNDQLMGDLPEYRITISRPFSKVGIDYARPLNLRMSKGRGTKSYKGYIAIFICLVTKAIHAEAVSDLTAEGYLNAFKRFSGRRGIPSDTFRDNATNFVLANKILEKNVNEFNCKFRNHIIEQFQVHRIKWHFIPPASSHFGGLWEAGVKSVKYHLERTLTALCLTFEELSTVLVQIKACLNSRPMTAVTDDIDDINVQTPGHFLIGAPLLSHPAKDETVKETKYITRYKLMERLQQQFWNKWSNEYLHQLQFRSKWRITRHNAEVGELVLIKGENTPPSHWLRGRITKTFPGKDGKVRVVNLSTRKGECQRNITKICPLPIDYNRNRSNEQETHDQESRIRIAKPTTLRKTRQSTKKLNLLSTRLVILLIPWNIQGQLINTTTFEHQPGVYFEDIGQIQQEISEWNILVKFNLTAYQEQTYGFQNHINYIINMCNKTSSELGTCQAIKRELNHRLAAILQNNELITDCGGRSKRGAPVEAVGYVANKLFGILDSNYAEYIEQQFAIAQEDYNHLLELLKEQTSISESTVNLIKKTSNDINAQFEVLTSYMNDAFATIKKEGNKLLLIQQLKQLISFLSLTFTDYENRQESILDIIKDTHHARVNPQIITPQQLKKQLSEIEYSEPFERNLSRTENEALEIATKIASLKKDIDETTLSSHHIHHYTITYTTLTVIIIVICYLVVTWFRSKMKIKSTHTISDPKPVPRRIQMTTADEFAV